MNEISSEFKSAEVIDRKKAYLLSHKALKIEASTKLVGISNAPYVKYKDDGFLLMVNVTPSWRIGLNDFNLKSGYDQIEFKDKSAYDNKVSMVLLEGTLSPEDILEKVDDIEKIVEKLNTSLKKKREIEILFELIYRSETYGSKVDNEKILAIKPNDLLEKTNEWIKELKITWNDFKKYNFK